MDKKEAVQKMITQEFNSIPLALIERAYPYVDGFENVTPLTVGQYVIYDGEEYEVTGVNVDGVEDDIHISKNGIINEVVNVWEVEDENAVIMPMWGTVWQAVDGVLVRFIEANKQTVADCGFTIFEAEDLDGYILGIDSAGYDFYEAHWTPLYDAQGLKWHDK